jgi:hypothetical protein
MSEQQAQADADQNQAADESQGTHGDPVVEGRNQAGNARAGQPASRDSA